MRPDGPRDRREGDAGHGRNEADRQESPDVREWHAGFGRDTPTARAHALDVHARADRGPAPEPTSAERSRLVLARVGVFLLALAAWIVAATPVFVARAILNAWWPVVVGYVVVLAPILVDQGYRARPASAGRIPTPELPPDRTVYLVAGFAADPQGAGWGSELARQLFAAADETDRPAVGFMLRARTERLDATYTAGGGPPDRHSAPRHGPAGAS